MTAMMVNIFFIGEWHITFRAVTQERQSELSTLCQDKTFFVKTERSTY
ncbi:hypothetical protein SAMN02927903_03371, partial [Flavobacterium caeni]